jgi:hypothetical protein
LTLCTCNWHVYMGFQWDKEIMKNPLSADIQLHCVFMLYFLKLFKWWCKKQTNITSSTWHT